MPHSKHTACPLGYSDYLVNAVQGDNCCSLC